MSQVQTASQTAEAAHTPGPWKVADDKWTLAARPWSGAIAVVADDGSEAPPILFWSTRGGDEVANARLIAAAPELLAALTVVLDEFDRGVSLSTTRAKAQAAIAKATGAAQ